MGAALIFRQLLIDPASYAKNVRPCLSVVNRIYRLDINICPFFLFRVPETQLKSIVWQTLQAVNFCHKHNVSMSSLQCVSLMNAKVTLLKNLILRMRQLTIQKLLLE